MPCELSLVYATVLISQVELSQKVGKQATWNWVSRTAGKFAQLHVGLDHRSYEHIIWYAIEENSTHAIWEQNKIPSS